MRHIKVDTIAAISTPIGDGGIGIVRLSGPGALNIADKVFISRTGEKPSSFRTYTVNYGHIVDRAVRSQSHKVTKLQGHKVTKRPRIVDEVLLTVMRAPKSYTKEDVVEINCHGGVQAAKKVLDLVIRCGARTAEPGEFTKRAFLNGRIDLTQAEAVLDIIRAKTEASLKIAMDQLDGSILIEIDSIREEAIGILSELEASIDFPEENTDISDSSSLKMRMAHSAERLKSLIDSYDNGMVLRDGVLAIICGKPNSGKSSLMNLLLKRDRVIVSPIPGTTRDAIEETVNLKGIPVRLVDTAGIADTDDLLESEGIKRSKRYLDLADIVILMMDASRPFDKADADIINLTNGKSRIIVINKCDLKKRLDTKKLLLRLNSERIIEISVASRKGIALLERLVAEHIYKGSPGGSEGAVVSNARHKELLDKTLQSIMSSKSIIDKGEGIELAAIDLREAVYSLGLIIGKSIADDVLDRIFEKFCIGK